jgi:hypothetical protein
MKSLKIQDLNNAKELRGAKLAAVRGGSNLAIVQGPLQFAQNGGGFSFGSPVSQVAPQTVTPTETNVAIANVLNSMNIGLAQNKLF